jgi:hypothetical protein
MFLPVSVAFAPSPALLWHADNSRLIQELVDSLPQPVQVETKQWFNVEIKIWNRSFIMKLQYKNYFML